MRERNHVNTTDIVAADVRTGKYLHNPMPDVLQGHVRPIGGKKRLSNGDIELSLFPLRGAADKMVPMVVGPDVILTVSVFGDGT